MTVCATCEHLHSSAKGISWVRWCCMKWPHDGINPVTGANYDPPYRLCRYKNFGSCKDHNTGPNCFTDDQLTQDKRKNTWTSAPRSQAPT